MDWPRAKTYLILAFLLADLFLGFRLWTERRVGEETTRVQALQQTLDARLEATGVALEKEPPSRVPHLPELLLKPRSWESLLPGSVVPVVLEPFSSVPTGGTRGSFLMNDPDQVQSQEEMKQTYYWGGGRITVNETTGRLTWRREGPPNTVYIENFNEVKARFEAEQFLRSLGLFQVKDLRFDYILFNEPNSFFARYTQEYDNLLLFRNYIALTVTPYGVESFELRLSAPQQEVGNRRALVSGTEALLTVLDLLEIKPKVVLEVVLGYYEPRLRSGTLRAVPAWRILVDSGAAYYVDAYSGELLDVEATRGDSGITR